MSLGSLRLCYVVSSEMTAVAFLKNHMSAALSAGYQVSLVANAPDRTFLDQLGLMDVAFHRVELRRKVSPIKDGLALLSLIRLFRTKKFDIVHSVSPKAGILAMLAARICGVPNRIHTFTGQVWVTRRGLKRWLLKQMDRLLAGMTTIALVDSPSQREFLLSEQIIDAGKAEVIGKGAICGVDGDRFRPDPLAREMTRNALAVPQIAKILLFLGRLNRDKGVADLARAFAEIASMYPEAYLLLVGPDEDDSFSDIEQVTQGCSQRVRRVEFTHEPEKFMAAADIFCLPSYREGFGMVVVEAAAAGLPTVASRIYGITDAVADGETGILHPPADVPAMVKALVRLLADDELRARMGEMARARVLADFSMAELSEKLMTFYAKIFSKPR